MKKMNTLALIGASLFGHSVAAAPPPVVDGLVTDSDGYTHVMTVISYSGTGNPDQAGPAYAHFYQDPVTFDLLWRICHAPCLYG